MCLWSEHICPVFFRSTAHTDMISEMGYKVSKHTHAHTCTHTIVTCMMNSHKSCFVCCSHLLTSCCCITDTQLLLQTESSKYGGVCSELYSVPMQPKTPNPEIKIQGPSELTAPQATKSIQINERVEKKKRRGECNTHTLRWPQLHKVAFFKKH